MKGVLSCLARGACRAGTRYFCSASDALVGPVHNIFFLTVHYLNSLESIPGHLKRLQIRTLYPKHMVKLQYNRDSVQSYSHGPEVQRLVI
jgi:hypothetical protein